MIEQKDSLFCAQVWQGAEFAYNSIVAAHRGRAPNGSAIIPLIRPINTGVHHTGFFQLKDSFEPFTLVLAN